MSKATSKRPRDVAQIANEQMEKWLLSPELTEFMQQAHEVRAPLRTGPYIAISREAGAGATQIARLVGQRLGWDVLDKELLDFMTQRYDLPRDMLEFVDETKANWVHNIFGTFFDSRVVSQEKYVILLERIMYLAALHGRVVFLGRGAPFALPRDRGLAVRIVAPKDFRVTRTMRLQSLSRSAATKQLDEIETGRRDFCKRYFHQDIHDPHAFDLVLNVGRIGPEVAAETIVDVFGTWRGSARDDT